MRSETNRDLNLVYLFIKKPATTIVSQANQLADTEVAKALSL